MEYGIDVSSPFPAAPEIIDKELLSNTHTELQADLTARANRKFSRESFRGQKLRSLINGINGTSSALSMMLRHAGHLDCPNSSIGSQFINE